MERSGAKCDIAVKDAPDPDKLAAHIVQTLQLKGFCVIDSGATDETCTEAVEEITEAKTTLLFKPPCEDVLDGLLGKKGSAAAYTFPADEDFSMCPTVGKFDGMASSMGVVLDGELPNLGLEVSRRSPCMVHETGTWDKGGAPPMTEKDATFWLQHFVWHKLMIIQFLGPTESVLELTYFEPEEDEDSEQTQRSEGYKLKVGPGVMVILRPDILGHTVTGGKGNIALSCWFLPRSCGIANRGGTAAMLTPTAKRIDDWSMKRLKQLAELGVIYTADNMPEQWRVVAVAAYKMEAPKELTRGGVSIEMALKGEILIGTVEVVNGLKWLKTMAVDSRGRPCYGYILIDGEAAGVGTLIEKIDMDTLPADWLVAKNHLWTNTDQVVIRAAACKFPAGHNIDTQFQPYTNGPDFACEVPMRRWDHTWFWALPEYGDTNRTTCKHLGMMDGMELFDNKRFSISNAEVISMDPQHRIALECTEEAFCRGGYFKDQLMRSVTGAYLGGGSNEWGYVDNCAKDPAADMFGCTGGSGAIQSNRLSFNLGLMGPSITITCEGASSIMAVERGWMSFVKEKVANIRCCSVGVYATMSPFAWVGLCWKKVMWNGSFHGRCKSFDEEANGFIRGDGTGALILNRLTETVDNVAVRDQNQQEIGLVTGANLLFHGQSASMNAPSGMAEQTLVAETCRQAHHDPVAVDMVDTNGEGRPLWDAVEAMSLAKALRRGHEDVPLALNAAKSNVGFAMEAASMAAIMRIVKGAEFGTMTPTLHLSKLNPHIDTDPISPSFLTECLPNKLRQSLNGVRGQSFAGTLAFALFAGTIRDDVIEPSLPWKTAPEKIAFWPGGGGNLENIAIPGRGYEIMGSWDGWESSHEMQESEGDTPDEKVFTYTATLGVNLFEQFQILLDGNRRKVLHPDRPRASASTPVFGPDMNCYGLNWFIDGRTVLKEEYVDKEGPPAINDSTEAIMPLGEQNLSGIWEMSDQGTGNTASYSFLHAPGSNRFTGQMTGLQPAEISDATIEGTTIKWQVHGATNIGQLSADGKRITDLKVTYGDEVVASFTGVWQQEVPREQVLVLSGAPTLDTGKPGDRYKVELRVSGRWRAVTWAKLAEGADAVETLEDGSTPEVPQALVPVGPIEDTGVYYVVADWNMWGFTQKMQQDDLPGTYYLEFKLLWDGGQFQIVRDSDWAQAFHPEIPGANDGSTIVGPDDYIHGINYVLNGRAGDVYRISLQRTFQEGDETRMLSWAMLRHEDLTEEERKTARSSSYYLVGSMDMGREQKIKMEFDLERRFYVCQIEIGKSGEEWFNILYNGDWSWRLYPNMPDAFPNEENPHQLLGPDDRGLNLFWKISELSGDEDAAGETYEIQLWVDGNGRPKKVEWSRM